MAKLNEAMQRFIVQALACYDTPTQVAESVKEEFDIVVTRQQVASYDPTKVTSKALAKKWRDLFASTRERFRKEIAEIPIADQAYRLRQLHRMVQSAMNRKNIVLAASLLEQAAKEQGGMFTNKRELSGPNGGPIPMMPTTIELVAPNDHSED
ncbi:DUF2280 domain-containing protein [Eoetvoesiella caeni]|uniref:DUF2280 domain-containing protein n=1 Tax=Eoetvoesiella caeni TaxID=645616 RepID=A0A366HCK3_9BURK|nr:DUF2280 domain-containing protein [Eoetvoesiella caeni]MCI2809377.1 DUF2280 domain-containing protein [Eoetvoesiella caeni]NYT54518.1 DUF2280 domain-containing protein [Eoetvoesiella caeni]RBP39292.1 hypothetical protein DFR37_10583 [Eoetvoesiella caeni]